MPWPPRLTRVQHVLRSALEHLDHRLLAVAWASWLSSHRQGDGVQLDGTFCSRHRLPTLYQENSILRGWQVVFSE